MFNSSELSQLQNMEFNAIGGRIFASGLVCCLVKTKKQKNILLNSNLQLISAFFFFFFETVSHRVALAGLTMQTMLSFLCLPSGGIKDVCFLAHPRPWIFETSPSILKILLLLPLGLGLQACATRPGQRFALRKNVLNWIWWYTPVISVLEIMFTVVISYIVLKASFDYIRSLWPKRKLLLQIVGSFYLRAVTM